MCVFVCVNGSQFVFNMAYYQPKVARCFRVSKGQKDKSVHLFDTNIIVDNKVNGCRLLVVMIQLIVVCVRDGES
jgi:hypothetical protein